MPARILLSLHSSLILHEHTSGDIVYYIRVKSFSSFALLSPYSRLRPHLNLDVNANSELPPQSRDHLYITTSLLTDIAYLPQSQSTIMALPRHSPPPPFIGSGSPPRSMNGS